jgi:translation initiation factor 1
MSEKDRRLVYSDDPKDKALLDGSAAKKAQLESENKFLEKNNFTAVFRIEKNGRGGKIVTVLDQLPTQEKFLKDLTKEFKVKCGVGGTYIVSNNVGVIEVQGDNRDKMKKILESKKIKFKGV